MYIIVYIIYTHPRQPFCRRNNQYILSSANKVSLQLTITLIETKDNKLSKNNFVWYKGKKEEFFVMIEFTTLVTKLVNMGIYF